MEGVLYSSVFKLNLKKFFSEEEVMRRNSFFVVSLFNRGCWSSRDNLFIKRVIGLCEGFSKENCSGQVFLGIPSWRMMGYFGKRLVGDRI